MVEATSSNHWQNQHLQQPFSILRRLHWSFSRHGRKFCNSHQVRNHRRIKMCFHEVAIFDTQTQLAIVK